MKRAVYLFICILAALLLLLGSCGPKKANLDIDLIVKSTDSEFWTYVYDGAKAASAKYEINLRFLGPTEEKDYMNQISIIEQSIKRNPDAIILAAGDYYIMSEPMEKAVESKIPVVMVDSSVNSDKWSAFISTDNKNAGRILAEEISKRAKPSSKIGIISFVKDSSPSFEREYGFVEYINQNTDMEILDTVYCYSNFETAEKLAANYIEKYPDISVIAGLNAQAATGAAMALDNLERDDILLAGIDCTVEQADYMERGILDVAVVQNPYLMGYYSVETAYNILMKKKVQKFNDIDVIVVDKNNLFSEEIQQLIFPFY